MATTQNTYTGNGSTTTFSFTFPYLEESDVKVSLDGVDQATSEYSFASATSITFDTAPTSGVAIRIYRVTDIDTPRTTFFAGSAIRAQDLNDNTNQILYSTQETVNRRVDAEGGTMTGNLTMDDANIVFEGSTADDFETTLTVVDPTADRTITLPDVTGTVVTTGDTGTVATAMIAADAVTGAKIADDTIDSEHYAAGSIDTEHIADSQVTTAKLAADAVTGAKIADDSIDSEHYVDGSIDTAHIGALQVTTAKIAADAITGAKIADDSIDSEHYVAGSIDAEHIASSAVTTAKIADGAVTNAKLADAELQELATMAGLTAAALADLTSTEVSILDGATVTTAELNILDGVTATATELNQLDGNTLTNSPTWTSTTQYPSAAAIDSRVTSRIDQIGGFIAVADDDSFPATAAPEEAIVSVANAGGMVISASGVGSGTRSGSSDAVTINNFPSEFNSTTLDDGIGLLVVATSTAHTYDFHRVVAKNEDVRQLSSDINDFKARYRVGTTNPTTDLDAGDLFFNTSTGIMLVYDATTSAWEETQTIGNFYINTLSSSAGTGGGSATFNGTAYRFALSNAPTYAQQLLVSVNGVVQKPNSGTTQPSEGFAIDGNDIIFSEAPATGANFFIVTIGASVNIGTPSDDTVGEDQLINGGVTTIKLAADAVTGAKIADDSIDSEHYVDGSIDTAHLAADVVTGAKIADDAIDSEHYVDGSIDTAHIADDAVTADKLANTAVTAGSYTAADITVDAQGRITAAASGTIGTSEIADDAVTADKLADTTVTAGSYTLASITVDAQGRLTAASNGTGSAGTKLTSGNTEVEVADTGTDGHFKVTTEGSERLRVDSSGKVGIGTTSPAYSLDLGDGSSNPTASNYLRINTAGDYIFALQRQSNASFSIRNDGTGAVYLNTQNSIPLVFGVSSGTSSGSITEHARIDSSGKVGIGTTSPSSFDTQANNLVVGSGSGYNGISIYSGTTSAGSIYFADGTAGDQKYRGIVAYDHTADQMFFYTGGSERVRIDGSGNVGIGTTTPGSYLAGARQLVISASASTGLTIATPTSSSGTIAFADGTGAADNARGLLRYSHSDNSLQFSTNALERLRIDSSGRLGIGTSSPLAELQLHGPTSGVGPIFNLTNDTGDCRIFFGQNTSTGSANAKGQIRYSVANNTMALYTNGSERARIDSSGRLLVGTSTARSTSTVSWLSQIEGGSVTGLGITSNSNDGAGAYLSLAKSRGTSVGSNTLVGNGDGLGYILFSGADGTDANSQAALIGCVVDGTPGSNDMPGRLIFSTTADGASEPTERVRITSKGYLKADNEGTHYDNSGNYHEFMSNNGALPALTCASRNASFVSEAFSVGCFRSASSGYSIARFFSGNGSVSPYVDVEFNLRGDGNAYADGAWNGGGADYAEYFEWSDGNTTAEDRRGISVVLDGDKIREAVAGEEPIGVISGNPSVVGDADIERWKGKYLRDDFGTYIQEDYEVEDEDGNTVTQQRRKLNPDYDPDVEYISREDRPEWDCVGLMGKLRIRKGQVTGSRWIKMRDISDNVEEWLVR